MTIDPEHDALDDALARLTPMSARPLHVTRVRERCHAVLATRRRASRSRAWTPADLLVAGGVAWYLVAAVGQALRLLSR